MLRLLSEGVSKSGTSGVSAMTAAPSRADAGRKPIRIGGLLRCCIATAEETNVQPTEGAILPCKWCNDSLRFCGGAWEWIGAKDFEARKAKR